MKKKEKKESGPQNIDLISKKYICIIFDMLNFQIDKIIWILMWTRTH